MEDEEAQDILIVDDNVEFRERAALALHKAFGIVALEENLDKDVLASLDWKKVRTVVTNGERQDYKRLHFLLTLVRQNPNISLVGLNLEPTQISLELILADASSE